ncbi:MAG: hypothetical protein AAF433_21670 [Bacteroidota bacterium]
MRKNNKEKLYEDLNKKYTDEELIDSYIFSVDLPKEEQKKIDEEFIRLRFERLKSMTEEEVVSSNLFTFKLKLRKYFKSNKFDHEFTFSKKLKEYIEISKRSNSEIAKNLGLHKTKLSRLINDREKPNIDLMYRLEEHSSKEIPAFYWWRIHARELEFEIRTDHEKRAIEAKKVENPLDLRA